ncbi:N-acetyltransferase [Gregarina niphandrodes]|uniref:N-acetyltransferase n=1 Tax=Gregarina niphandrodes TaxID=110365 RepID=A0A023B5K6_GRENI|nr:N-acetyltransferase [Gregarina niphandrodes]EZG61150.1 N-acetyltransferase [Gregarina niphandrodes]|eukprot:XP_011130803.1 N-acetyltransferase [Gregarina niphandrodes]
MAFSIRPATVDDLFAAQALNLTCLPENYQLKYYFYKRLSWPQLQFVAEDAHKNPVGYTLGKIETEEEGDKSSVGHITSLGVLRTHRQAGLAKMLMNVAHNTMVDTFDVKKSSLHVRVTNLSAFSLYCNVLGYQVDKCEVGYYENNEDAFSMRKVLQAPVSRPTATTTTRVKKGKKDKGKKRR